MWRTQFSVVLHRIVLFPANMHQCDYKKMPSLVLFMWGTWHPESPQITSSVGANIQNWSWKCLKEIQRFGLCFPKISLKSWNLVVTELTRHQTNPFFMQLSILALVWLWDHSLSSNKHVPSAADSNKNYFLYYTITRFQPDIFILVSSNLCLSILTKNTAYAGFTQTALFIPSQFGYSPGKPSVLAFMWMMLSTYHPPKHSSTEMAWHFWAVLWCFWVHWGIAIKGWICSSIGPKRNTQVRAMRRGNR